MYRKYVKIEQAQNGYVVEYLQLEKKPTQWGPSQVTEEKKVFLSFNELRNFLLVYFESREVTP